MPLQKRRGNFHYRFQVAGHVYTGNTGFTATQRNRAAAEGVEAKAWELVVSGRPQLLRLTPKPFDAAMAAFLTWAKGEHRAHHGTYERLRVSSVSLLEFFGTAPLTSLTVGQIEGFKAWRRRQGREEVTIRHDLHCLGPMLRHARLHNWLGDADPLDQVEIPSDQEAVRMHVLTSAEESAYFETCSSRGYWDLHDLGRLMIRQGCRPGELMALRPEDVDVEGALLRISGGKTASARRSLRLASASRRLLAGRIQGSSLWVFPRRRDPNQPISRLDGPHERVMKALGYAKGDGFVVYDLRHSFGTRAAQSGVDLATLAAIMGHASITSVMKYVHITQKHQDAEMDRLDVEMTAAASCGAGLPQSGPMVDTRTDIMA